MAPRDRDLYLADFALEAAQRIEAVEEDKLDRGYLQSEDFVTDFDQVGRAVIQRKHHDKRKHFLAALANSATVDRPGDNEQHRFLDLLEQFRDSHLRLLAAMVTAEDGDPGGTGFNSSFPMRTLKTSTWIGPTSSVPVLSPGDLPA